MLTAKARYEKNAIVIPHSPANFAMVSGKIRAPIPPPVDIMPMAILLNLPKNCPAITITTGYMAESPKPTAK